MAVQYCQHYFLFYDKSPNSYSTTGRHYWTLSSEHELLLFLGVEHDAAIFGT